MSELTRCNYCSLKYYRRVYSKQGKRILVVNSGGFIPFDIYAVPRGVRWCGLTRDQREQCWISSMMEIGDSCAC